MKKIVVTLILIAVTVRMCGQTYDTVYNRSNELYYSEWYDTSLVFLDTGRPCCLFNRAISGNIPTRYIALSDYTPRPLRVRGLALMHTIDYNTMCQGWNNVRCSDTSRVPEYIRLYQGVGDTMIRLASVRWDTAKPQVLKLPHKQDTSRGFEYCYLYRVYFDTSITVDSVFYIAGSIFNNIFPLGAFIHRPTYYVGIGRQWSRFDAYVSYAKYHSNIYYCHDDEKEIWYRTNINYNWYYGPFFAIAPNTSYVLELHTADSTTGSVEGGGWYVDSTYATITAVPERGYRFSHWNDGDATNPRTIFVTQDTTFTAYFEEAYYTLAVTAEPEQGGTVTGSGTYRGNDTATMAAMPNEGYAFVGWRDGDTARTRQLEMTQDTAFTALFRSTQGINSHGTGGTLFTLTPNPARGSVTVKAALASGEYPAVLTVSDVAGREVLRREMLPGTREITFSVAELPAGTYFVTLTTAEGTSTKRLVVE